MLLENFSRSLLRKNLFQNKSFPIRSLNDLLYIEEKDKNFEVFTAKNHRYLEKKYSAHFYLYENESDRTTRQQIVAVSKPLKKKYNTVYHLKLQKPLPTTRNGIIEDFEFLIHESLLPRIFECTKTKNCKYSSYSFFNYKRHVEKCGKYNVKKVHCTQTTYGDDMTILRKMADQGFIPMEALEYRNFALATYDIETVEVPIQNCAPEMGMVKEATHRLLSIAVGSNIPGVMTKCWVRKNMDPCEESILVKKFVDYLYKIQEIKRSSLPEWINDAMIKIEDMQMEMKARNAKWWQYGYLAGYKRALKAFTVLDCFGFNSCRFDLPVLMAPLILELKKRGGRINILKKMAAYISIQNDTLSFKDALRFSAPCSYDKFVKVWEVENVKSIWPYTLYNSVAEIRNAKKFPSYTKFRSALRGGALPDIKLYTKTAREFHRRRLLPAGHPEKFYSMLGFLKYYNALDVGPLAEALTNCFTCYDKYFGVNPITALSLPALASTAMYKSFELDSPLLFTFAENFQEISNIFRQSVFGGLVNVYLRHVTTFDPPTPVPHNARYARNGDPYSCIVSLDFTSMYLFSEMQDMPTTPGLLWTKTGRDFYKKKIMTPGHSLKAQKWLEYMQVAGKFFYNTDDKIFNSDRFSYC